MSVTSPTATTVTAGPMAAGLAMASAALSPTGPVDVGNTASKASPSKLSDAAGPACRIAAWPSQQAQATDYVTTTTASREAPLTALDAASPTLSSVIAEKQEPSTKLQRPEPTQKPNATQQYNENPGTDGRIDHDGQFQETMRRKDFDICNIKLNMKEMEGKLQAYE